MIVKLTGKGEITMSILMGLINNFDEVIFVYVALYPVISETNTTMTKLTVHGQHKTRKTKTKIYKSNSGIENDDWDP